MTCTKRRGNTLQGQDDGCHCSSSHGQNRPNPQESAGSRERTSSSVSSIPTMITVPLTPPYEVGSVWSLVSEPSKEERKDEREGEPALPVVTGISPWRDLTWSIITITVLRVVLSVLLLLPLLIVVVLVQAVLLVVVVLEVVLCRVDGRFHHCLGHSDKIFHFLLSE